MMHRTYCSVRVWTRGRTWNATVKTLTSTTVLYCRCTTAGAAMEQGMSEFWKLAKYDNLKEKAP